MYGSMYGSRRDSYLDHISQVVRLLIVSCFRHLIPSWLKGRSKLLTPKCTPALRLSYKVNIGSTWGQGSKWGQSEARVKIGSMFKIQGQVKGQTKWGQGSKYRVKMGSKRGVRSRVKGTHLQKRPSF